MSDIGKAHLSSEERALLKELAEIVVPRWAHMPSASEIGLCGEPLDRALASRPDLIVPLRDLLAEIHVQQAGTAIRRLAEERPAALGTLMQAIAGAYYMHPAVRAALGGYRQRQISHDGESQRWSGISFRPTK